MLALSMNIASYADEGILFHLVQESTLLCWHVVVSPQVGVERSHDESSHVITGAKLSVIGDNTPRLATAASPPPLRWSSLSLALPQYSQTETVLLAAVAGIFI